MDMITLTNVAADDRANARNALSDTHLRVLYRPPALVVSLMVVGDLYHNERKLCIVKITPPLLDQRGQELIVNRPLCLGGVALALIPDHV